MVNFIVNSIFRQPPLFLGLIALLGLLVQRRSAGDVISGTVKTVIGVIVLMKGVDVIAGAMAPLADAFSALYAIEGALVTEPLGMTGFITQYGSAIGLVMVLSFATNLVFARFTRFKSVFLTGHIFFWIAFMVIAVGVESGLESQALVIFGTVFTSLYIIVTPWMIRPFVKQVTGDDSFTIGHTTVGMSLIASYLGKWFGNKAKSTEDLAIPESLGFLRDNVVITGLVMMLIYMAASILVGADIREAAYGAANSTLSASMVFSVMQGFTFGAGVMVMLTGVRVMMSELMPAFHGIAEKLIPDAVPALDCPMIFPYAPNAVIIGFIVSMISSIITIALFARFRVFSVAILPLTVACFFDIGPAAVFANATGGIRGTVIASAVCGVLLISFAGLSIVMLSSTVPDFLRAFGGNDFSILAIVLDFGASLFT
ncbi:MAG: PTS ascorbate transporter subunit IIC [Proteocatella sp.]